MTRFEKWSVWSTSLLTVVTGVVYFWMKYGLETSDPWAVVNHPLQPLVLKLHILVAPLLVFALGLIAVRHVWRHFRLGVPAGRRSGVTAALVAGPMVVSGYLIQGVTAPGWLRVVAWLHMGAGIAYTLALVGHWWVVIRRAGEGEPEEGTENESADPVPTTHR